MPNITLTEIAKDERSLGGNCPGVHRIEGSEDFAVVGRIAPEIAQRLVDKIGDGEAVVVVPRNVIEQVARKILAEPADADARCKELIDKSKRLLSRAMIALNAAEDSSHKLAVIGNYGDLAMSHLSLLVAAVEEMRNGHAFAAPLASSPVTEGHSPIETPEPPKSPEGTPEPDQPIPAVTDA